MCVWGDGSGFRLSGYLPAPGAHCTPCLTLPLCISREILWAGHRSLVPRPPRGLLPGHIGLFPGNKEAYSQATRTLCQATGTLCQATEAVARPQRLLLGHGGLLPGHRASCQATEACFQATKLLARPQNLFSVVRTANSGPENTGLGTKGARKAPYGPI